MAMVINHNIPALQTYNVVNATQGALSKSIQKLSTGLRINSAADDAAGLAISEKMRAQISGLSKATDNAQDGISMLQTAEGALSETHSILQRMRELSVQAANDTLTAQDRSYIQLEIDQLREEVTRIGNTTQFNTKKLLNGDAAVLWSSSDNTTKAIINGGLRTIDQFGQKSSAEGNYKIEIKADPGQAQVQKSDIFKVKHPNVVMNKSVNVAAGVKDVKVNNVPAGSYVIKTLAGEGADAAEEIHQLELEITDEDLANLKDKTLEITAGGVKLPTITFTDVSTVKAVTDVIEKAITDAKADPVANANGELDGLSVEVNGGKVTIKFASTDDDGFDKDTPAITLAGTATQDTYNYSIEQKLGSANFTDFNNQTITLGGIARDGDAIPSITSGDIDTTGVGTDLDKLAAAITKAFEGKGVTVEGKTVSTDNYLVFKVASTSTTAPSVTVETTTTNGFDGTSDPTVKALQEHTATVTLAYGNGASELADLEGETISVTINGGTPVAADAALGEDDVASLDALAAALTADTNFEKAGITFGVDDGKLTITYTDTSDTKPADGSTAITSDNNKIDSSTTITEGAGTASKNAAVFSTTESTIVEAEEAEEVKAGARGLGKADAQYEHSLTLTEITDTNVAKLAGRTLTIDVDGTKVDVAFTAANTDTVANATKAIEDALKAKDIDCEVEGGKVTVKYTSSSDAAGAIKTSGSATEKGYDYGARVVVNTTNVADLKGASVKLTIDGTEIGTITVSSADTVTDMDGIASDLEDQLAAYGITDVSAVGSSDAFNGGSGKTAFLFTYVSGNDASATSGFELEITKSGGGSVTATSTYKQEAVFSGIESSSNAKNLTFKEGDTPIFNDSITAGGSNLESNFVSTINANSTFKERAQAEVVDTTNVKITYYGSDFEATPSLSYNDGGALVAGSHIVNAESSAEAPMAVQTSEAGKPAEGGEGGGGEVDPGKPDDNTGGTTGIPDQPTPGPSPTPATSASFSSGGATVTQYTHELVAPTVATNEDAALLIGKKLDITIGDKKATVTFDETNTATAAAANQAIEDKIKEAGGTVEKGKITFATTNDKFSEAGAIKLEGDALDQVETYEYTYEEKDIDIDDGNGSSATYGNFAGAEVKIDFGDSGYDAITFKIADDALISDADSLVTALNTAAAAAAGKARAEVSSWGLTAASTATDKIDLTFTGQFAGTAPKATVTITGTDASVAGTVQTGKPGATPVAISNPLTAGGTTSAAPKTEDVELDMSKSISAAVDKSIKANANILLEVTNVDKKAGTVTFSARALTLGKDGTTDTLYKDDIVVRAGDDNPTYLFTDELGDKGFAIQISDVAAFEKGSKLVFNATMDKDTVGKDAVTVAVTGNQNQSWSGKWGNYVTDQPAYYVLDASAVKDTDIHFTNYYVNSLTGEVNTGDIIVTTTTDGLKADPKQETIIASFDAAYIGQTAAEDVALRDLDKFWTTEGVFMLTDAQTVTLTQGDGKQASVTLYGTDTLGQVAEKLNDAIAVGLGQGKYLKNAGPFVTFVANNKATKSTSESVEGTFVIRSIVAGKAGEINVAASENLSNALSLNQIQASSDSEYRVTVRDAHTDTIIADNVKITGNKLVGVINDNVDVVFDAMSGVKAKWNDNKKEFEYETTTAYTTLHLADNTTVFQIGANEGEDMGVNIGDMRATALGLDDVLVTDRESASRSITIIDNAIDKVSTQRAKLGAYQNRLEHTITNLTTAHENLTSAESRIRDTDMAKEMMNFMKLQITLQAGTSMLAQANQLSRNVLSLLS